MKRPHTGHAANHTGDIRKDYTEKQLAGIGSVTLAYNEAEAQVDALMAFALGLSPVTTLEVTSRINGIDGKIEIAKVALQDLGASTEVQSLIANSLGNEGFALLKQYRDAVIHARDLDAVSGIAYTSAKRGKLYEVLLTVDALSGLYERLVLMKLELIAANGIAIRLATIRGMDQLNRQLLELLSQRHEFPDQTKAKSEREILAATSRYREHQTRRQSLPPLPEFPSESELQQARLQWLRGRPSVLMGWQQELPPHPRPWMWPGVQDLRETPLPLRQGKEPQK